MTLHLRKLPRWTDLQQQTHERLKHEIAEEKMSSILVEKRNRHIRDSQTYRQNGGTP